MATAQGCATNEIMRRSGLSKSAVWRWQERTPTMALSDASLRGRPDLSFQPLSFAENMAAMVLFGLVIALEARPRLKVEKS